MKDRNQLALDYKNDMDEYDVKMGMFRDDFKKAMEDYDKDKKEKL